MSESSSSCDEKDIAEEGNQDIEVKFRTKSDQEEPLAEVEDDKGIEKPKWKDLREQC